MASQQNYLNGLATKGSHTGCGDNISAADNDIGGGDPIEASLQQERGDERALDGFIQAHPLPTLSPPGPNNYHLPGPVVIPQRRPGSKDRGFIQAYAPSLAYFGIDQDEFINFLNATNKAFRASKWLGAIQLAAVGTGFVPNSIAFGVSLAVQIVAGVIAKAETRWKYV